MRYIIKSYLKSKKSLKNQLDEVFKELSTNRINDYWKLLSARYGLSISRELLIKNKNTLYLKNSRELTKILVPYCRSKGEGCQICKSKFTKKFNTTNFHDRPMEFPGFINPLDFGKEHVKEVMVIGEAAGPSILTNLNITFGLGWFYINEMGEMNNDKTAEDFSPVSLNDDKAVYAKLNTFFENETKYQDLLKEFVKNNTNTKLWEYLKFFSSEAFGILKENVYVTDLVKCNAKGNSIWKNFKSECYDNFLKEEIRLINPKIIIFLGASSFEHVEKQFNVKERISPTEENLLDVEFKVFNLINREYLKKYYESKIKNLKPYFGITLTELEVIKIKDDKRLKIPHNFPLFGEIGKNFNILNDNEIESLKKCIKTHKFPIFGVLEHPSDSLKGIFFMKIPHTSKTTIASFWSLGSYMYKNVFKKLFETYVINRLDW